MADGHAYCHVVLDGAHEVGDAVEPGGDELGSVIRLLDGTSEELEPIQQRRLGVDVVRGVVTNGLKKVWGEAAKVPHN